MPTTERETHDPIVKGRGDDSYAICDVCVRKTFRCVPLVTGSRKHVNRVVREHRDRGLS